ncbi:hypothetical protein ACX6XY_04530 [Streptomyces sp. O3]
MVPLRLLGLGLMLFGLLYSHVVSPEATVGHLRPDGAVSALSYSPLDPLPDSPYDSGGRSGGHGRHTATVGECALGQPPSGPDMGLPCLSPLAAEAVDPAAAPYAEHAHRPAAVRGFVAPIPHAAESPVLRI